MIRSVELGVTPTAREAQSILARIEEELREQGASVERTPYGAIHFRLPPPWRARQLGALHIASSGRATIGAAVGSPWRVRYELNFRGLQVFAIVLSLAVVLAALRTGRVVGFWALAAVWVGFYVLPHIAATTAFRRLVKSRISGVTGRPNHSGDSAAEE